MSKRVGFIVLISPVLLLGAAHAAEVAEVAWKNSTARFMGAAVVVDPAGHAVVAGTQYQDDFSSSTRAMSFDASGGSSYVFAYDGSPGGLDRVNDAAVDPVSGGVVLTGSTQTSPGETVVQTIALDASGRTRWIVRGGADDPAWGNDVEVDRSGNVYVVGSRYSGTSWDLVTLAYAPDGTLLWRARFDAGDDESATSFRRGLQIDSAGQVYVASDFHLIAYDPAGRERWVMDRQVTSIALDPAENLVVTAPTAGTELVDASGRRLWRNAYGSISMSLGDSGDVFLAGIYVKGTSTSDWDFEVTRLRADGTLAWTRRYDNGSQDRPADLAVDANENVYVTGESWSRYGLFGVFRADYYTVKYDANGTLVWSARVKDLDAGASAIAVGSDGRVTVTGVIGTTVQYRQVTQAPPPPCPWYLPWCWGR